MLTPFSVSGTCSSYSMNSKAKAALTFGDVGIVRLGRPHEALLDAPWDR